MHGDRVVFEFQEDVVAEVELCELEMHVEPSDREFADFRIKVWCALVGGATVMVLVLTKLW
jgi:hypothetical protein